MIIKHQLQKNVLAYAVRVSKRVIIARKDPGRVEALRLHNDLPWNLSLVHGIYDVTDGRGRERNRLGVLRPRS